MGEIKDEIIGQMKKILNDTLAQLKILSNNTQVQNNNIFQSRHGSSL